MGLSLGFLSCSIGLYSVFEPAPYCLDDCNLEQSLKSGRPILPAPFFFLKMALVIQSLLCFPMNCESFCSSSMKNAIVNLIRITLNVQIAFGSIVTFPILSLSNQELEYFSISLCHLSFLSLVSYSFLIVSSINGAGKTGRLHVKERNQNTF